MFISLATTGVIFGADDARVIFPAGSGAAATDAGAHNTSSGALTIFGVLLLAVAGGWLLWKNRQRVVASGEVGRLAVTETKSLGNRQFLVVASYDGKKFLLGVCPGRIELLSPLTDPTTVAREKSLI